MDRHNEHIEKDNQLAEFTDRLLNEETDLPASNPDRDLLSLEKTILRLNHAFPPEPLDETTVKQMLARMKTRAQREKAAAVAKPSFWKRFFDFQSNPQVGLIYAVAALVILVIVTVPNSPPSGSPLSGAASSVNTYAVVGIFAVLFVLYWVSRRK